MNLLSYLQFSLFFFLADNSMIHLITEKEKKKCNIKILKRKSNLIKLSVHK